MALRNAMPLRFSPQGLSDAIDGTNVFSGACAALQNLIPDPTTANLWQGRPASFLTVNFNAGSPPHVSGFISALDVFGNIAYGLIDTDQFNTAVPFAYNLLTQAFITITGITG